MLGGERQDRGIAAEGRGDAAGVKVVGGHHLGRGLLFDVTVRVDAAGQDQEAPGIDPALGIAQVMAERGDPTGPHRDVGKDAIDGGRHRSAFDDQIEFAHLTSLICDTGYSAVRKQFFRKQCPRQHRQSIS